ncbi:MAG: hypothetical protein K8E24_013780 [Methanobacterium paludis]|nr:hypothetical protein [Methanobacterium paludis]
MDRKNWMMLLGIGLMFLFLGLYYVYKAPIFLFNITLGALALIYGFYTEGEEIKVSLGYCLTSFSVNIVQWLLVIYIFYNSAVHLNEEFYIALIVAIMTTIFLIDRLQKEYIKTFESSNETSILRDSKKIALLCTGLIIIIGSLTGFIVYHAFTFFCVATFGLTIFVYGYYHENGKINVSVQYVENMAVTIVSQWIVIIYFYFKSTMKLHHKI